MPQPTFTHDGVTYEDLGNGKVRVVGYANSPAVGPAIGGNPQIPLQMDNTRANTIRTNQEIASQPLQNENTRTNIQQNRQSMQNQRFNQNQGLRQEFNALPEVKAYSDAITSLGGALKAPDTAQGDLSIVYSYAKAMDPGSVVREGEMDMANSTASLPQALQVQAERLTQGKRLPPEVRTGLIETMRQRVNAMRQGYDQQRSRYAALAQANGFDPQQIVGHPLYDAIRPLEENYIKAHGKTPRDPYAAFAPPPTGANNTPGASTDGYNETPDAKSAAFWQNAIRTQVPYREAMKSWAAQAKASGLDITQAPDPGQYQKAQQYVRDHPNADYNPVDSVTRTPLGPVAGFMNDVAQSPAATFGVDYYNALGGGIPLAAMGDQGARFQAVSSQLNPKSAFAGELGGTIGGATLAGKGVGAAAPYLGKVGEFMTANAARTALSGDLGYGAVSGASQNPDNPLLGAGEGAAAMGAGNIAGRYLLGPLVRTGARGINKAAGVFGAAQPFAVAAPLDPSSSAIFRQAYPALDPIKNKLSQAADLNLPYSLGDADPRLQALVGSAVRKSPDVAGFAADTLIPRQAGQAERAISMINTHLAPSGDIPTMQADILKRAQATSKPLYDTAKGQDVPELTAHPKLKEILDRPAAQSAIRKGYETALNKGEDVGTLTYATDPNGNTIQYGNPSWNVIHYARQALDQSGETDVRHALDKQISVINPAFKKADAAYAGAMKGSDALKAGADATAIRVTPQAAQRSFAGFPNNGPQFQQGYASSMADAVNNAQLSGNPYARVYGTPNQQAKVGAIFPGAPKFGQAYGLENDMAGTAREALGGSPTATRLEADKHFAEGDAVRAAADLGMSALTGIPPQYALRRGAAYLARDAFNLGVGNAAKKKADAIAPLLLSQDPVGALRLLDDFERQTALRKAYLNRTGAIGGMFGAPMVGAPLIYGPGQ